MANRVQHPNQSALLETTRKPRQFGFLLAALILATIAHQSLYLYGWLILLMIYPVVLSFCLPIFKSVRGVMLLDGVLVGLLISLFDFNLEVSVVLLSLLAVSTLIVGNINCLVPVLLITLAASTSGGWLHPDGFVGGESFYFVAFATLIAYVVFIGILVFDETTRLKKAFRDTLLVTSELESFKHWISPFVPPPVRRESLNHQPRRQRITILFCDICGFTELMDSVDETLVAQLLNDYFSEMTEVAQEFGGVIDKFIGDGIMIFFCADDSAGAGRDAKACVAMALEMRARFRHMSARWCADHGGKRLELRIGIHCGYALVGDFGSTERREYTALGSTVNIASRLESAAYPDEILVSQDVVRLAGSAVSATLRGPLVLRGFQQPVSAWTVRGLSMLDKAKEVKLLG